jgi:hypothetical protein
MKVILSKDKTVGFGYRTSGIATTPIVQAPTFVCGLNIIFLLGLKKIMFFSVSLPLYNNHHSMTLLWKDIHLPKGRHHIPST